MRFAIIIVIVVLVGSFACSSPELPSNRPPSISGVKDSPVILGDTLYMPFSVSDPDGDYVHISLTVFRTQEEADEGYWPKIGMPMDEYAFWFVPVMRDGESRDFALEADDKKGGVAKAEFTVTIVQPTKH